MILILQGVRLLTASHHVIDSRTSASLCSQILNRFHSSVVNTYMFPPFSTTGVLRSTANPTEQKLKNSFFLIRLSVLVTAFPGPNSSNISISLAWRIALDSQKKNIQPQMQSVQGEQPCRGRYCHCWLNGAMAVCALGVGTASVAGIILRACGTVAMIFRGRCSGQREVARCLAALEEPETLGLRGYRHGRGLLSNSSDRIRCLLLGGILSQCGGYRVFH